MHIISCSYSNKRINTSNNKTTTIMVKQEADIEFNHLLCIYDDRLNILLMPCSYHTHVMLMYHLCNIHVFSMQYSYISQTMLMSLRDLGHALPEYGAYTISVMRIT